jgi:hypothetical protein
MIVSLLLITLLVNISAAGDKLTALPEAMEGADIPRILEERLLELGALKSKGAF